ncbi:hypothetical protein AN214_03905 [Pseudoalteromonas sp. P1-9]|nr:hypothetical protein AN214_03905 [Pseudoalteromonas sp. P1-9]
MIKKLSLSFIGVGFVSIAILLSHTTLQDGMN